MRSDALSAMSAELAKEVMDRIESAGFRSATIPGAWKQRRLCIVGVEPSATVVAPARGNPEALNLALATTIQCP